MAAFCNGSPFGKRVPGGSLSPGNGPLGSKVWLSERPKVAQVAPLPSLSEEPISPLDALFKNAVLELGVHFKSCSGVDCGCGALAKDKYRGQCGLLALACRYKGFPLSAFLRNNITADFTPGPELSANLTKFLQDVEEWFGVKVQIPTEYEMDVVALEFCRRLKEQDDALSKYKYNPSS